MTTLQLQQHVHRLARELRDADLQVELAILRRQTLLADLYEARQRLRDQKYAGWLAKQGAAAVRAVEQWLVAGE